MNKVLFLDESWMRVLSHEFTKDYMKNLRQFLILEKYNKIIYPLSKHIFCSLQLTSLHNVKVVIVGQDPYSGTGQAHGLAFSVLPGISIPSSLKNIYLELYNDLGFTPVNHGCLIEWAIQGVLLLNSVLTVEHGKPGSHMNMGWEIFTDKIIQILSESDNKIIFVLWGKYAQKKYKLINFNRNIVIMSSHPSPFSVHRGFFDSKPFSKVNNYLMKSNNTSINWKLKNL